MGFDFSSCHRHKINWILKNHGRSLFWQFRQITDMKSPTLLTAGLPMFAEWLTSFLQMQRVSFLRFDVSQKRIVNALSHFHCWNFFDLTQKCQRLYQTPWSTSWKNFRVMQNISAHSIWMSVVLHYKKVFILVFGRWDDTGVCLELPDTPCVLRLFFRLHFERSISGVTDQHGFADLWQHLAVRGMLWKKRTRQRNRCCRYCRYCRY